VLVHGNPTWSYYYRKVISLLAPDHRVIAPDHMGCGLSDKPQDYSYTLERHIGNLERLLEHLRIDRFALVGHDWGGADRHGLRRPSSGADRAHGDDEYRRLSLDQNSTAHPGLPLAGRRPADRPGK